MGLDRLRGGGHAFPWVGAAIETQLATIPACLARNCPQRDAGSPTAPWELRRLAAAAAPQAAEARTEAVSADGPGTARAKFA